MSPSTHDGHGDAVAGGFPLGLSVVFPSRFQELRKLQQVDATCALERDSGWSKSAPPVSVERFSLTVKVVPPFRGRQRAFESKQPAR